MSTRDTHSHLSTRKLSEAPPPLSSWFGTCKANFYQKITEAAYLSNSSLSLLMVMIMPLQAEYSRSGFADCSHSIKIQT
jgi:hypothetical protein